jgi:hypothetical protein
MLKSLAANQLPGASLAIAKNGRLVLARDAISGLYEHGERELAAIGVHLMSAAEVLAALKAALA